MEEPVEMALAGQAGVDSDLRGRNSVVEVVVESRNYHSCRAVSKPEKAASYNLERPDMDKVLEDDFV